MDSQPLDDEEEEEVDEIGAGLGELFSRILLV